MSEPTISIVIPLLNEAAEIERLAAMLVTMDAEQVIAVDGGSTDQTVARLRQAGITVIEHARGRAVQMNAGAAMAESDILLFLHADTEISQYHLDRIRRTMGDPEIVGGRFDVRLTGTHPLFRIIAFFMNLRSRLSRISTGDQAMFVRRSVFTQMGGFPDLPLMEDIALSRSLKWAGAIACLRDKVTVSSRRWENEGILRTVVLMWRLRLLYWLGVDPVRLKARYRD